MTRTTQIDLWLKQQWKSGKKGAHYQDIRGYRVAVTTDTIDPDLWTWVIYPPNQEKEVWSVEKYDDEDAAKQGVLEELADRLGII